MRQVRFKVIKSYVIRWSTWSTSSWRTWPTTPSRVPCGLRPHPGEHGQLLREERPVKVACATSHKVGIIVMMSLDCQELKDPPPFILELDH